MGDYELHADYDRDGRLTARPGEYALRDREPGAIVVPNLDADRRRLPAAVATGPKAPKPADENAPPLPPLPVTRDRDQPVRLAIDDELLPLVVRTVKASAPDGAQFFLRVRGFAKIHVELFDERGTILKRGPGAPHEVPITPAPAGKDVKLRLEVQAPAGTPAGRGPDPQSLLDTQVSPNKNNEDETKFSIELRSRDASGVETLHDRGLFTIAPMIVVDNAAPAVRLYMCNTWENWPSVAEVQDALERAGAEFVDVPDEASGSDTWLQDQLQHVVMQGADGYRQCLIHLPRMRNSNTVDGASDVNLERFVSSHFASRDLGVFDDLWKRSFAFRDVKRQRQLVSFREAGFLFHSMQRVTKAAETLDGLLLRMKLVYPRPQEWAASRRAVPEQLRIVKASLGGQPKGPNRVVKEEIAAVESQVETIEKDFPLVAGGIRLTIPGQPQRSVDVDNKTATRMFLRLGQAHGPFNYGGNVEASPPIGNATLGKLVVGNVVFEDAPLIDPDLLRVLDMQNKQPLVFLDTGWLHVGHVDEVMGFVPDPRAGSAGRRSSAGGRPGFSILRASASLAMRILELARERYASGLPAGHPQAKSEVDARWETTRLTIEGAHPITRMFRGKLWRHIHESAPASYVPHVAEPPEIYQRIWRLGFDEVRYRPGPGPVRWYLADATVREVLFCEMTAAGDSTNRFIEETFLQPIEKRLQSEFRGVRLLALPVLFDRVETITGWKDDSRERKTSAYTPSVVNFQPINGRLLVPRPYGPRMRLDDVREVIGQALKEQGQGDLLKRLTASFIRQRKLTTGVYWIVPQDLSETLPGTTRPSIRMLDNASDLVELFRDSFPGVENDEIKKRIVSANRSNFDARGLLKQEPLKFVIADDMLDLFEVYVELVAAELEVPLFWVDAWYYHIRLGGIHCGTNVLRMPRRGSLPDVWTVSGVNMLERIE